MDAAKLGELVAEEISNRVSDEPDKYGRAYVDVGTDIKIDISIGYTELGEMIKKCLLETE